LLIHGARATLRFVARKRDPRSRWISAMRERRGTNEAVALANKNARVLWALLAHNEDYRVPAFSPISASAVALIQTAPGAGEVLVRPPATAGETCLDV